MNRNQDVAGSSVIQVTIQRFWRVHQHVEWLHGSVSDIRIAIDDMVAEGDRVVVYWTLSGTHTGEFFGVPATNKTFTATAVSLLTFAEGLLSEYMVRPDALSVVQQLGAAPA